MPDKATIRAAPPGLLPWALSAGLLLLGAPATRAQYSVPGDPGLESGIPVGPAIFAPSLSFTWQHTNNVFLTGPADVLTAPDGPESSGYSQITPVLRLMLPYSNSRLDLTYSPQYRSYSRVDLPNKIAHNLRIANDLVLSNGMELDFNGSWLRGIVETTAFDQAQQIRFSTTPFTNTDASLAWSWTHPSRWGTVLTADTGDVTFDQSKTEGGNDPAREAFFDNRSSSGFLDATWLLRPDLTVFAGVGGTRTVETLVGNDLDCDGRLDDGEVGTTSGRDLDGDGRTDRCTLDIVDRDQHFRQVDLRIGARGRIGARLTGEAQLASTKLDGQDAQSSGFSGITVRANGQLLVGTSNRIGFFVQRQPIQTLTDTSEIFVFQTARLGWSFSPGLRNVYALSAAWLEADYPDQRLDTTLNTQADWSILFGRHARLSLSVRRSQRRSTNDLFEFDETRASIDWTIGWF